LVLISGRGRRRDARRCAFENIDFLADPTAD
jgi:hypothetical protein